MLATAKELLKAFNPVAVFTCSDEITLVFPALVPQPGEELEPVDETKERKTNPQFDMPYGGKIQKVRVIHVTILYHHILLNIAVRLTFMATDKLAAGRVRDGAVQRAP
jgi:hypothetical protein